MQCLARNRQTVYYAMRTGETENVDKNGLITGERTVTYTDPKPMQISVSAARGETGLEQFGTNVNYTHTLVTSDLHCPLNENSVLWIGRKPCGNTPYNFIVVKAAPSLTNIVYAVREVKVTAAKQN